MKQVQTSGLSSPHLHGKINHGPRLSVTGTSIAQRKEKGDTFQRAPGGPEPEASLNQTT